MSPEPSAHRLPMFPLGSVTFPGQLLPLQVFEARYRELVRDCLLDDRRFGTVLIERGSEVGGGDLRCDIGTFVTIAEAEPVGEDRWRLNGVGTGRLRVVEWLADDPYPCAMVTAFVDAPADEESDRLLAAASAAVSAWCDRARSLGLGVVDPWPEIPAEPDRAVDLLTLLSPLGPMDRQRVLSGAGPTERLTALLDGMDGQIEVLDARFGPG